VAVALGDKTIENFHHTELRKIQWGFNREIGWGLLALVALVEVTGEKRFREECDQLADYLQGHDRAAFKGAVNLSNGRPGRSLERQMIDNGFGYASMIEAVDRYQRVSNRRDTHLWLVKLLNELRRQTWNAMGEGEISGPTNMVSHIMAIGYERTGNQDFLAAGLAVLDHALDHGISSLVTGEVKISAMAYRGFCRFLGHADRAGLLERFELVSFRNRRK